MKLPRAGDAVPRFGGFRTGADRGGPARGVLSIAANGSVHAADAGIWLIDRLADHSSAASCARCSSPASTRLAFADIEEERRQPGDGDRRVPRPADCHRARRCAGRRHSGSATTFVHGRRAHAGRLPRRLLRHSRGLCALRCCRVLIRCRRTPAAPSRATASGRKPISVKQL
jgi:hypothetical protein